MATTTDGATVPDSPDSQTPATGNAFSNAAAQAALNTPSRLGANDELALLYRQEWQDYLQRYAPLENQQVGMMSDSANALERQQAVSAVGSQYANGKPLAEFKRQALGFGATPSATQVQAFNQHSNLQQGLDTVNSYNRTTTNQIDRAFGGIGSPYQPGSSLQKPRNVIGG